MVVLGGVVINNSNFSWNNLSAIGPQYVIGVLLIALLLTVKSIIWVVKRINKGESVWGGEPQKLFKYNISADSIICICYLSYLYHLQYEYTNRYADSLIHSSFFILGCIIAGVSGILTCVFLIYGFN